MKLAIIDKDGTLVKPRSGETFVQNPTDQMAIEGVQPRLNDLEMAGYKIAIASNQGGVKAGFKSLDSAIEEMRFCLEYFVLNHGVFCPDDGETLYQVRLSPRDVVHRSIHHAECKHMLSFRKPGPGMLIWLMEAYGAKPEDTIMIGDRSEDEGAATAAGVKFLDAETWRKEGPGG